ncbi:MAG: sigma-54 dependent transcriptional regulator [Proteobacteria bacterium]|jgi:DNA-binding NtrC family response regulator|nr:sigma-54 dependent transcriptional regulator [Pseudomonadota bacterium]
MREEKNSKGFIVVIDDDPEMRSLLVDHLRMEGYTVEAFGDGKEAMMYLRSGSLESEAVELVLTDIRMPEVDGLSVLRQYHPSHPHIPVVLMTAHASIESAVEGLRRGAFDYLIKPFKLAEISLVIKRALNYGRLQRQNKVLTSEVKKTWTLNEIVGKAPAMKSIFELIERVAPATSNVLITGESGTGKEVVARSIHSRSQRANKPFIAINVTAIPDNLLESELFGHTKGSFTGAISDKKGLIEEAEGGTLFLDEIGDMNLSLQAKLLQFLQLRKIKAVGSNVTKDVDVRVIAATHKDLKRAIQSGTFREDLYYRLAVIPIVMPALRHRTEDIPLLANHFLQKYSVLNGGKVLGFSSNAMMKLMSMPWHGNVRELENLVERLVVLTPHPIIQSEDIPLGEGQEAESFFGKAVSDHPTLADLEKRYIRVILEKTGGKKEKAAHILGINRRTLYRKEREYGLIDESAEEPTEDHLETQLEEN